MLVLKREEGESIEISGSGRIRLTVVRIDGRLIVLGFQGDASMQVVRTELLREEPQAA